MNAPEVTRAASDHYVFQVVRAAARVRDEMIVLHPHCLESCVLLDVLSSPRQRIGINYVDSFSDFGSDDWDATKATMVKASERGQRANGAAGRRAT